MASIYSGGNSSIGIAEEVTYATPVARTNFRPILNSSLGRVRGKGERQNLSVGNVSNVADGDFLVSDLAQGRIEFEMVYENMGMWLKHLMGQVVDTGAGPFTHTYSRIVGSSWPVGLTIGENRGDAAREVYRGMRVKSWDMSCRIGEWLKLGVDLIGRTSDARTDVQDVTVLATPSTLVKASDFTFLTYNAVTYRLISLSLKVDNGFDTRLLLGDTLTQQPIIKRRQTVVLDVELEVEDALQDEYFADTESNVSFHFDDPVSTNDFQCVLSNAKIQTLADPLVDFNIVTQRVQFKGFGDGTNALTNQGLQLIMINSVASGTAN